MCGRVASKTIASSRHEAVRGKTIEDEIERPDSSRSSPAYVPEKLFGVRRRWSVSSGVVWGQMGNDEEESIRKFSPTLLSCWFFVVAEGSISGSLGLFGMRCAVICAVKIDYSSLCYDLARARLD